MRGDGKNASQGRYQSPLAILHIVHRSFTPKTIEKYGSVNHVNLVNDYSHILDNSIQRQTGSVYRNYCGKRFTSFTSFTSFTTLVIPIFSGWPMVHGWFTWFTDTACQKTNRFVTPQEDAHYLREFLYMLFRPSDNQSDRQTVVWIALAVLPFGSKENCRIL